MTQHLCVLLDDVDHRLLDLLQRDASTTLFDLGQAVGLSTSAVQRRIGRYKAAGLIDRQVAVLSSAAVGDVVLALVLLTLDRESTAHHAALRERLVACPAVQQCYDLAGEHDYAVMLAARGMRDLRRLVDELFMDAPNVKRFVTLPVYNAIKVGLELPTR